MATVSLGYEGYSQSLSGPLDVRVNQNSYGDSSSSSGDESSWSDWEAEGDGQVRQARPPVVKVSDGPTRKVCRKFVVQGASRGRVIEMNKERDKKEFGD